MPPSFFTRPAATAAVLLGVLALALARPQQEARSCAPAFARGKSVSIASESALIVWDEKTRTEHFIRRGTFDTAAADFGFLVPTPTEPDLGEASDAIFETLARWTAPRVEVRRVTVPRGGHATKMAFPGGMAPAPTVEVLGQQRVAGLDAVKLRVNSPDGAKALTEWLKKHGYSTRPALEEWLKRYVADGWVITAFKIAQPDSTRSRVSTQALRMSFKVPEGQQPYYPYREPEDMRTGARPTPRLLRLYVLSNERVAGMLGNGPWVSQTMWAKPLPGAKVKEELLAPLKLELDRGEEWSPWLTQFDDGTSPRYGVEEVTFDRSADQTEVEQVIYRDVYVTGGPASYSSGQEASPPLVIVPSILLGVLLVGLGAVGVYFYLSNRSAAGAAAQQP